MFIKNLPATDYWSKEFYISMKATIIVKLFSGLLTIPLLVFCMAELDIISGGVIAVAASLIIDNIQTRIVKHMGGDDVADYLQHIFIMPFLGPILKRACIFDIIIVPYWYLAFNATLLVKHYIYKKTGKVYYINETINISKIPYL